jgi:hypothetical protein
MSQQIRTKAMIFNPALLAKKTQQPDTKSVVRGLLELSIDEIQPINKFPALMEPKGLSVFTKTCHWTRA